MLDTELADVVDNLRSIGADVADIEVKKAAGGLPKSLRATLSAFANTHGGVLILGLDEASGFTATGLTDAAKLAADLGSVCSDEMEPPLRPLITIHQFEGEQVLVAEIPQVGPERRPCYFRGAGLTSGSYVRVGDGDRLLSSYEVQVMLSSRGQPKEDEEPVPGVGEDDLLPADVEAFVARLRTTRPYAFRDLDREAVLRRAKILVPGEDGQDTVSLAGLLALGRYPQEHVPQLVVTFVHYPTDTGPSSRERFLDNVALEGPVPTMLRDTLAALHRNMSRRAIIVGLGREDVWDYPETALREAVVNALVHRDLSPGARGAQIHVEMYPSRLVIRSPGGLFGPVTVDLLGEEGISSARNATLIRILEDVPMSGETRTVCENRGSGIRAMLDSLLAAGMSPPVFDDRISSFAVTFPNHTLLGEDTLSWIRGLGEQGLSDSQCVGLALVRQEGAIDERTYRAATGVNTRVATNELQDLVARELLTREGTRRWVRYQLAPRATSRRGATRADRRAEVLAALGEETLSRAELADRIGLTDQTIQRWLKILRDEGTVELVGTNPKSPHTRYRRTSRSVEESGG